MISAFKRKQFNFEATDKQLAKLLTRNVKAGGIQVNVVSILDQKIENCDKNFVKIIVGQIDPNNESASDPSTKIQEEQFKKNLKKYNIKYKTKKVIEAYNTNFSAGTPGIVRMEITALVCKKIPIYSYYVGESILINGNPVSTSFIDVPKKKLDKSIRILNNLILSANEKELCINRFNI